jgi:hypothetical protein
MLSEIRDLAALQNFAEFIFNSAKSGRSGLRSDTWIMVATIAVSFFKKFST